MFFPVSVSGRLLFRMLSAAISMVGFAWIAQAVMLLLHEHAAIGDGRGSSPFFMALFVAGQLTQMISPGRVGPALIDRLVIALGINGAIACIAIAYQPEIHARTGQLFAPSAFIFMALTALPITAAISHLGIVLIRRAVRRPKELRRLLRKLDAQELRAVAALARNAAQGPKSGVTLRAARRSAPEKLLRRLAVAEAARRLPELSPKPAEAKGTRRWALQPAGGEAILAALSSR